MIVPDLQSDFIFIMVFQLTMEEELPYQPIVFIKTGVIGGSRTQAGSQGHSFDFTHKHILVPRLIENPHPVFYMLFHTPSVYNWLITVPCRESILLNTYITPAVKGKAPSKMAIDSSTLMTSL